MDTTTDSDGITSRPSSLVPGDDAEHIEAVQIRTIVAASGDGWWRLDERGRILDCNDAYCHKSEHLLLTILG